jgi:hypothetical protein
LGTGVDLSISLDSYSLGQWDAVIFKLANNYLGLVQNFLAGNDTSNYNYYYFRTINMVMAQKKTTNVVSTVGIGQASGTINYQQYFGFSWVKVHDTSNSPMSTNPQTLKYGTPATLNLNSFTTYSSATLTRMEGV